MAVSKLRDGDYRPDGAGGFQQAAGAQEVLERVLFQLTAHRGAFPLLPTVGSRLYLLPRARASARQALAAAYTAEALGEEPDLTVTHRHGVGRGDKPGDGLSGLAGGDPGGQRGGLRERSCGIEDH